MLNIMSAWRHELMLNIMSAWRHELMLSVLVNVCSCTRNHNKCLVGHY